MSLILFLQGCTFYGNKLRVAEGGTCDKPYSPAQFRVHYTSHNEPKGVVILVPGLNNVALSLTEYANLLTKLGYHTFTLRLTAQRRIDGEKHKARPAKWMEDFRSGYCIVKSEYPELPLYTLGYSMGSTVILSFLELYPDSNYEGMILLAPGVCLTCFATTIELITWLRHFDVSLYSRAPREIVAHTSTSLHSYQTSIELIDFISTVKRADSIPATIIMSPKDDLISRKGVERWLKKNKIYNWKLNYLSTPKGSETVTEHLLLLEQLIGTKRWNEIKRYISEFLQETNNNPFKLLPKHK